MPLRQLHCNRIRNWIPQTTRVSCKYGFLFVSCSGRGLFFISANPLPSLTLPVNLHTLPLPLPFTRKRYYCTLRNPVLITPYNANVSDALSITQRSPAPRQICPLIAISVDLALFSMPLQPASSRHQTLNPCLLTSTTSP